MRWPWIAVLLCGCGRFGFDELDSSDRARGRLSVGDGFACAVRGEQVWCWGEGDVGQLGVIDGGFARFPSLVPGLPAIATVSAGRGHACAVAVDGDVHCWGINDAGQLGRAPLKLAVPGDYREPGRVLGLPAAAISVGTGVAHSCALLIDRTVWCWGSNEQGQLGRGTITPTTERPSFVIDVFGIADLAIADDSSCARATDNTVWCWGENGSGQAGDGTTDTRGTPRVIDDLAATALALGGDHACAILPTGHYTCWGTNEVGQLGNGTFLGTVRPTTPSIANGLVDVAAAFGHTCGLFGNGEVSCWGHNIHGVLGNGSLESTPSPMPVELGGRAVAVSAGRTSTCAILESDGIRCWGWGSRGALGDGRSAESRPQRIGLPATSVTTGRLHSCATDAGGDVYCWGNNDAGQLGDGTTEPRSAPSKVMRTWVGSAAEVKLGDSHTCIRTQEAGVWCWGDNTFGQLGDGTNDARKVAVQVTLPTASRLELGFATSCALHALDGGVSCWGNNGDGGLGNNSTGDSPTPVLVVDTGGNPISVDDLAVGDSHACAVRSGSPPVCWGDNSRGQQGSGTADRRVATAVPTIILTGDVIAGAFSACAIQQGSPTCWGDNGSGLLIPSGANVLAPTASSYAEISFLGHRIACDSAGCWGNNFYGQLGTGDFTGREAPSPIVDLSAIPTSLSAAFDHGCAISSGEVYCWGDNAEGQLGLGTSTRSTLPVDVVFP